MPRSRRVVAYVRPGARELASQQITAIQTAATEQSWRISDIVEEQLEAGTGLDRPGLRRALDLCRCGEAHLLVVARLDRLAASLVDLGTMAEWFLESRSALVSLDLPNVDTSTEQGKQLARMCVTLADWERALVATRTQDELAARRRQGLRTSRPTPSRIMYLTGSQPGSRTEVSLGVRGHTPCLQRAHAPPINAADLRPRRIETLDTSLGDK